MASISSTNLTVQILGFLAILLSWFVYTTHKRKVLIVLKFITDFLWGLHYFLLGAYTGALMNAVNMVRETIFLQKSSKKWARSPAWAMCFITMSLLSTVLSWQGAISLLPAIGSSVAVIGLWCSEPKHIRLFSFPGVLLWLIYSLLTKSYMHTISNSITLLSIAFGIIKDFQNRKIKE